MKEKEEGNGEHLFLPIAAKRLASGTDDHNDSADDKSAMVVGLEEQEEGEGKRRRRRQL